MGVKYLKPTRKGELRRLTAEYCDRLKEERLSEYHEELRRKQATLAEEEAKIQQLIDQESKYLGTQNPPKEK